MRISDWSSDVCSSDLVTRLKLRSIMIEHLGDTRTVRQKLADGDVGIGKSRQVRGDRVVQRESMIVDESQHGRGGEFLRHRADVERAVGGQRRPRGIAGIRSEEHTSELQSLMRISYAVFCLKKKKHIY